MKRRASERANERASRRTLRLADFFLAGQLFPGLQEELIGFMRGEKSRVVPLPRDSQRGNINMKTMRTHPFHVVNSTGTLNPVVLAR